MDAVRGIGFDLDHTLAIDNRLERVAFLRLLERILAEGGRYEGTLTDEIDGIDELLKRQRSAEFSIDEAVRGFVAVHGVTPATSHVEWFRRIAVAMVDDLVVPLPGVAQTLEALREAGISLAVLTNGWNPMQRRKAERAGFRETVLVSSEIGVQKPAARAFEILLDTLKTPPGQTWYVGDDPQGDIEGAAAAGLRTVWIDWERKTYPAGVPPPEHTIERFEKLLELFPSPARVR
ncbi:MAG TPA: HAD family hydrolase [Candidatus Binatia bacterium]|nr:HAD family hydrolase [Candidatus Binatia bacterium]